MALPNLNIKLQDGALGRVASTSDGIAGLILTGKSEQDFSLEKVYQLSSVRDLSAMGVTEEKNALICKEVNQFYAKAGDGAELYLMGVAETTTLTSMCGMDNSPMFKLIASAKGRIRLVGINCIPADREDDDQQYAKGIDSDAITAAQAAQELAESFASQVNPIRVLVPALGWNGETSSLFEPRGAKMNRVAFVMAADKMVSDRASAAIGQVLGTAASIPVNHSLGRVKNGTAAVEGFLTNGKAPEECNLDLLHDAGYIIYRTFIGKNGYYYNDDPMADSLTSDYSNLNLGRVIDKAIILAYTSYIDEIMDSVEVDENGNIPESLCVYYEGLMDNAVYSGMRNEISSFSTYIDSEQNILSSSVMEVNCKIVPKGVLREININLGFENPSNK